MKFLLFGTGDYYQRYKKWFCKENVLALLDNSPDKQNTIIDDIRVLSPSEGIKLSFDAIVILSFYVKQMRAQLLQLGVADNNVYHFYDLHHLLYTKDRKKSIQFFGDAEQIVKSNNTSEKRILLLSQDLTLGGPSIALFHAAEILVRYGYRVVFASMIDGPLREKLLDANIPVIVDVNLQIETMKDNEWIRNFSLMICNTINYYVFLSDRDLSIPIIWWLHDSEFFYDGVDKTILNSINRENLTIVSVGPVPERAIRKWIPDLLVGRLLYGVEDTVKKIEMPAEKSGKVCFVTIGYIEERKGQDILIQAIQMLSDEVRKRALFYLVGQDTSLMAQQLKKETEQMPEIIFTGTVDRNKINDILNMADVLICSSREDPMPTVVAEAMMHGVPCIVSDAIGTVEYICNGIDGSIFKNEEVINLADTIRWHIENEIERQRMGKLARGIFEKHFSMSVCEEQLIKIVKPLINN